MKDNDRWVLYAVLLVLLIGLSLGGLDIYSLTHYDKVESMLTVRDGNKPGKKNAYASYEYMGTRYEDKYLDRYDAFTMKNGKSYVVLINPASPEKPHTTSFALEVLFIVIGAAGVYGCIKKGKRIPNNES